MSDLQKKESFWPKIEKFRREINALFNKHAPSMPEFPSLAWDSHEGWIEVDIEDNEKKYVVTANVPGIDTKNIEISYSNPNLVIKGKTESYREEKNRNYVRTERSEGAFCRSFTLPDVDEEKIEATHKHGVLFIDLPKSKTNPTKKITIKS